MNYEQSPNDKEILSADDERLGELCRTLKKVEAPKDFDFHLKARLATAKADVSRPRFGYALRYALPALALFLTLGLLAYTGGFLTSGPGSQITAGNPVAATSSSRPQNNETANTAAPSPSVSSNNALPLPAEQNSPKAPERQIAVKITKAPENDLNRKPVKDRLGGGSEIKSVRPAPLVQPPGFEQKPIPQSSPNDEKTSALPVKEVLSIMGINAELENGKWTVKTVTPNSLGANSGLKPADVIEAIDDQAVSPETVFRRKVNGTSLTVRRQGEQMTLRTKQ